MIVIFLFTILSAWYDNGKRFVDHTPRFIFRAIVVGLISYFTNTNIFFNAAIFYILFDYTLNILEGRDWNYLGKTAKIDILWNKVGGWIPQFIFKITFLIITACFK